MANVRIVAALERAQEELESAYKQIRLYTGIEEKNAMKIDNIASSISDMASDIAGLARQTAGDASGAKLNKAVRRALGFTNP